MAVNNSSILDYPYEDIVDDLIKECQPKSYSQITAASFITVCCFSLLGNCLLLYTLVRFEDLKRVTVLFVLNLAIFDLLFTLTLPLFATEHINQWVFGDVACKIVSGAYFVGIYGSLILVTTMTVDRFLTVVVRSPWLTRRRRLQCARAACLGSWLISGGVCLKEALTSQAMLMDQVYTCNSATSEEDNYGYYAQFALLFLLPLAIIIICYSAILHTLRSTSGRQMYRTALVVLCIVVAFFICWGPYHIIIIIMATQQDKDCEKQDRLHLAYVLCRILAYSHCCVNPVLFMLGAKSRTLLSSVLFCSPELRQAGHEAKAHDLSHSNILQHSVVERLDGCKAKEQNVTELKSF
ncbi:chemokine XC receptor 1-like isoform X1 [Brachyhypopomus gauderio]|uniref:chemokine XC receptor 1-like isoform X1 n=1 Tax=Brachyhypopomus gauderio TaxID=698409 RepID=UPI0040414165